MGPSVWIPSEVLCWKRCLCCFLVVGRFSLFIFHHRWWHQTQELHYELFSDCKMIWCFLASGSSSHCWNKFGLSPEKPQLSCPVQLGNVWETGVGGEAAVSSLGEADSTWCFITANVALPFPSLPFPSLLFFVAAGSRSFNEQHYLYFYVNI